MEGPSFLEMRWSLRVSLLWFKIPVDGYSVGNLYSSCAHECHTASDLTARFCLLDNFPAQITSRLVTGRLRNQRDPFRTVPICLYDQTPRLVVEVEL